MTGSIIINCLCIGILALILVGVSFQHAIQDSTVERFVRVVYSGIIYSVLYIISDLCEGNTKLDTITFVANLLLFFCIDFIVISFTRYLNSLLINPDQTQNRLIGFAQILCFFRMFVITIFVIAGYIFSIENGLYVDKDFAYVPHVLSVVIILLLVTIVLLNYKSFTTRQIVVIILYLIFPVVTTVLEIFISDYSLTGVGITLSILMIYILLQDTTLEKSAERQLELEKIINRDELTGAYNRNYFNLKLTLIKPNTNIGVLFANLNSLRKINETNGFEKGDEKLKIFANLALNTFGNDNLYRISGDEFVVIFPCDTKNEFILISEKFRTDLFDNQKIAAIGYCFGKARDIIPMIRDSENKMTIDKIFSSMSNKRK